MNKLKGILILCFIILSSFFSIKIVNAAINLAISPIKYELEGGTGSTITKTAKIRNPSNKTLHIITGKSDFIPNGENGIPRFVRKSEMVYPDQQLSEWITISTNEFDLAPGETKIIDFDINIPDNATPGGHYGAVFFKNNNSESSSGASIGINVDYGILILLEVKGQVIIDAEIEDPIINTGGGGGGGGNHLIKDYCPNGDNSESYYDGTCNGNETNTEENTNTSTGILNNTGATNSGTGTNIDSSTGDLNNNENEKEKKEEEKKENDFKIGFEIPIKNKGNTHIKPKGKIVLKDEDGKVIKNVGKEVVVNNKGAIIGERIVNYIPINDVGGFVIPGSSRTFKCDWKGFPYRDYDNEGNPIIKYRTPDEYYTKQNLGESIIVMPWEKIEERKVHKIITADFNLKYKGSEGEDIEYNSAKEFPVEYTEKYVTINYLVLCPFFAFLVFILILIISALDRRTKCEKCGKTIKKDMKVCPYCGAKQKKKK